MLPDSVSWTVSLAVKPAHLAKTRLAGLGDAERADLVRAMLQDVLAAVFACPSVRRCVVVTADAEVAKLVDGADLVPETRPVGLNAAYRSAIRHVGREPLALLMADLPNLTGQQLDQALGLVPDGRAAVVADAQGIGTTLLAARRSDLLRPCFGPDSRRRHQLAGALDITELIEDGLRTDIDTEADLDRLGARAGGHTQVWLADCLARR